MGRRSRKKRVKLHYGRLGFSVLAVCGLIFAGMLFWPLPSAAEPIFEVDPLADDVPEPVHLSIRCTGDIMAHKPQLSAAYDAASGSYSFEEDYRYIKPYIEGADLALTNVETTFPGDGNYKGYPIFNSPDSLASAIASAGYDVAFTANNHMMDTGLKGALRTMDVLREQGLTVVGARREGENRSAVVDVKGVKVGIVAYTYETSGANGSRSINGGYLPAEALALVNSFRCSSGLAYAVDEDRAAIAAEISWCRQSGADIVIAYFHWGNEYQRQYTESQEKMARFAADAGADIIFASHPHVLQGIGSFEYQVEFPEPEAPQEPVPEQEEEEAWIIALRRRFGLIKEQKQAAKEKSEAPAPEYWTKTVPVYYSMGNLISNQRAETLGDHTANARYTEQGMIAWVDMDYHLDTGEISGVQYRCMPTWVEKYAKNGKVTYYIIPLDKNMNSNPELIASGHLGRAQQALEDVKALLGAERITDGD